MTNELDYIQIMTPEHRRRELHLLIDSMSDKSITYLLTLTMKVIFGKGMTR